MGARRSPPPRRGLEVDCSGISAADSAGLAVLLDWLAAAQARRAARCATPACRMASPRSARISEVQELLQSGV